MNESLMREVLGLLKQAKARWGAPERIDDEYTEAMLTGVPEMLAEVVPKMEKALLENDNRVHATDASPVAWMQKWLQENPAVVSDGTDRWVALNATGTVAMAYTLKDLRGLLDDKKIARRGVLIVHTEDFR